MRKALDDRRELTFAFFEHFINFFSEHDPHQNKDLCDEVNAKYFRLITHMLGGLRYGQTARSCLLE